MVTLSAPSGLRVMPHPAPALPAPTVNEGKHLAKGLALQAELPVEKRFRVKLPARCWMRHQRLKASTLEVRTLQTARSTHPSCKRLQSLRSVEPGWLGTRCTAH